ncbi:MAG: glycogen synthase [Chlamydiota bacterium]
MHIVHIASELAPIAKVGGLADVVHGLCRELNQLGHTTEILLPKYDCLQLELLSDLKVETPELWASDGPYSFNNTIWSAHYDGLTLRLIETHHSQLYFNREVIYGCPDDIDRFTYFSRAAMEYLFKRGKHPDILHVHDWPTALIPVLQKEIYSKVGFKPKKTVLTIHNMEHQGRCTPQILTRAGLPGNDLLDPDKMQDPYSFNHVNLLKGGIEYSDQITTVSPKYEIEIQSPEGGFGLQETVLKHRKKLKGILNGIDCALWNPETDGYLFQNYPADRVSKSTLPDVIAGKEENKKQLRIQLGLAPSTHPLIGCITRLVPQKSPTLIKHAIERTLEKGGQFVLLGSSPIPEIQNDFLALKEHYRTRRDVALIMDNDERLAHWIYAAADMFIIPSLFEPCGLTQLIAMRYGTVPIARLTGGLADTVFDVDTSIKPLDERNGFTFEFPDTGGVNWALDRAMACYKEHPKKWHSIILNGMRTDHSWKHPAMQYLALYKE